MRLTAALVARQDGSERARTTGSTRRPGVAGALALARMLKTFVFGAAVNDPTTFIVAAALLLTLAIPASLLPAARLTRIDPVAILR